MNAKVPWTYFWWKTERLRIEMEWPSQMTLWKNVHTSEYFVFISIGINLFRCSWFLFLRYENVSRTQICYIAMHGVYGIFIIEYQNNKLTTSKIKNPIKIRTLHKFHFIYGWYNLTNMDNWYHIDLIEKEWWQETSTSKARLFQKFTFN